MTCLYEMIPFLAFVLVFTLSPCVCIRRDLPFAVLSSCLGALDVTMMAMVGLERISVKPERDAWKGR